MAVEAKREGGEIKFVEKKQPLREADMHTFRNLPPESFDLVDNSFWSGPWEGRWDQLSLEDNVESDEERRLRQKKSEDSDGSMKGELSKGYSVDSYMAWA